MVFTFGLKEYGRYNEVVLQTGWHGRKAGFHCSFHGISWNFSIELAWHSMIFEKICGRSKGGSCTPSEA